MPGQRDKMLEHAMQTSVVVAANMTYLSMHVNFLLRHLETSCQVSRKLQLIHSQAIQQDIPCSIHKLSCRKGFLQLC